MSNKDTHHEQHVRFVATEEKGEVSALLVRPENARYLLVLGHGAGVGMEHASMALITAELADVNIASFRYQFPYMERGRGGMDMASRFSSDRARLLKGSIRKWPKPWQLGRKN